MSYEEEKAKNERLVKEKAQKEAEKNAAIPVATPVVASAPSNIAGDPQRESNFQNYWSSNPKVVDWRKEFKAQYGEEPSNSDGGYDYRGAFDAGLTPERNADDGNKYHWDSIGLDGKDLKSANHPTRWKSEYMKQTGVNPDEKGITFDSAVQSNPTLEQYRPQTSVPPVAEQPVVTPVAEPLSRAEQLMQQLYSTREAAPVHDQAKEDRLVRMGRINQIGRGIGVLGDVLTLGLGGKVNRSQPDRVSPMLYQQYQALMDKEKADQDSYKYRSYQNDKENLRMGIGEERRKDQVKIENKRYDSQLAQAERDRQESGRRFGIGQDNIENAAQARIDAAVLDEKNRREREDRTGSKTGKGKDLTIMTGSGKTHTISLEEGSLRLGRSVGSPEVRRLHPDWFDKTEIMKDQVGSAQNGWVGGKVGTGEYTYKLNSRADKDALIRADLELEEEANSKPPVSRGGSSGIMMTDPGMTNAPIIQRNKPAVTNSVTQPEAQAVESAEPTPEQVDQFTAYQNALAETAKQEAYNASPEYAADRTKQNIQQIGDYNKQKEDQSAMWQRLKNEEAAKTRADIEDAGTLLRQKAGQSSRSETTSQKAPILNPNVGKSKVKEQPKQKSQPTKKKESENWNSYAR